MIKYPENFDDKKRNTLWNYLLFLGGIRKYNHLFIFYFVLDHYHFDRLCGLKNLQKKYLRKTLKGQTFCDKLKLEIQKENWHVCWLIPCSKSSLYITQHLDMHLHILSRSIRTWPSFFESLSVAFSCISSLSPIVRSQGFGTSCREENSIFHIRVFSPRFLKLYILYTHYYLFYAIIFPLDSNSSFSEKWVYR